METTTVDQPVNEGTIQQAAAITKTAIIMKPKFAQLSIAMLHENASAPEGWVAITVAATTAA